MGVTVSGFLILKSCNLNKVFMRFTESPYWLNEYFLIIKSYFIVSNKYEGLLIEHSPNDKQIKSLCESKPMA